MKPLVAGKNKWTKGIVKKRLDERSYEVATDTGTFRKNRIHLRNSKELPGSLPAIVNPGSTDTNERVIDPIVGHATNGSEKQLVLASEQRQQEPIQQVLQGKSRRNQGVKPAWLNDYVS